MDINRDRERFTRLHLNHAPLTSVRSGCDRAASHNRSARQEMNQLEGLHRAMVFLLLLSLLYHKLTTLLIEEEEEATGMPFSSTAWQQSLVLVLDLSNFYKVNPLHVSLQTHLSLSLSLSVIFFPHHFLGLLLWVLSSPTVFLCLLVYISFLVSFILFAVCFLPCECCSSTNLRFLPTVQILRAETFVCCINWVISKMFFFFSYQ